MFKMDTNAQEPGGTAREYQRRPGVSGAASDDVAFGTGNAGINLTVKREAPKRYLRRSGTTISFP